MILEDLNQNHVKKMLLIAFVDAIISGFFLKIFPFDYTINLAVAILPIYYFFDRKLVPVYTSIFIALVGLLFRTLTGYYYYGGFANAFWADFNFLYFDLTYGLVFTLIYYRNAHKTLFTFFLAALMGDFLGNAAEFISRFGLERYLVPTIMPTLLTVAIIRGTIAILLVSAIKYYQQFLRKEEHEERYRLQINLLSHLRSEIYFLKNNTEHVESVMDEAFSLYRTYDRLDADARKTKALNIAKNVHEIKKNYFRVMEGIDEVIYKEMPFDQLSLADLAQMLTISTSRELQKVNSKISFECQIASQSLITEHSMLMSVLRNLVNNAIESIEGQGCVLLKHTEDATHHYFIISDTGKGIHEDAMAFIFKPGFSTKYDDVTGNANRGIGLTLVKDIVEKYFDGEITVSSELEIGTVFHVRLPIIKV